MYVNLPLEIIGYVGARWNIFVGMMDAGLCDWFLIVYWLFWEKYVSCFFNLTILLTYCLPFSLREHQAKQLKDYENAVIAKRLEELDEDEIQALVEEIERDEF